MADTRDKIKDAALKLFVEKGFRHTSIADIERAAGLAPRTGGFYRHFPGKVDLAVEIGETGIIESREELGLDMLPLGDTRSELMLIARGYAKAADRQAPLAALIAEVQHIEQIQALEKRVNEDLLEGLLEWLGDKPFARGKSLPQLTALTLNIFGGWIFYLHKRGGSAPESGLTDDIMLDEWATFWAGILDGPARS